MFSGVVITAEGSHGRAHQPGLYRKAAACWVLEFLVDLLPQRQSILMANLELAHPVREALCSVFVTAAAVLGGLWTFRKKI